MKHFVLHGDICYCEAPGRMSFFPSGWLVCDEGRSAGVFGALPEKYEEWPVVDCSGRLILPGLCDLHVHAPQFAYRGLGMDMELIEWLNRNAFPEEARYADETYADRAYAQFADDLRRGFTTRASVFATLHVPATLLLAQKLEQSGLMGYVGKVNMDRNSPENLREESAAASLADTERWLDEAARFERVRPILTPRFIPSCSDELTRGLGRLSRERDLPVQSHLSENVAEIEWVKQLCPDAKGYADAYERAGLLSERTVMAHVVHPTEEEIKLLAERRVMAAHCPASNMNLASGIAPVRRLLEAGVRVGLGSDVAGGQTTDMMRAVTDAIQVSKLRWRLADQAAKPLTLPEALYLATKGGGAFFGKVGSFEPGYELDAIVLDDSAIVCSRPMSVEERVQRAVYLSGQCRLVRKFVAGRPIDIN
ncbi:MAG: amidohydrolase family protein [Eubacteriales bacterium]|nr:amidohydrolase family protein [Eubacteriales bacterium]